MQPRNKIIIKNATAILENEILTDAIIEIHGDTIFSVGSYFRDLPSDAMI
ncbi:MAG: hypothetical protein RJA81_561, partial [Planctomycetota bacterium]